MKHPKKNGAPVPEAVTFGEGENPRRGRWPFFEKLAKGKYFEVTDLTRHTALRTAASRAGKKLKKTFSVRKVTREDSVVVLRVYRE